jgi:hypothetical protein
MESGSIRRKIPARRSVRYGSTCVLPGDTRECLFFSKTDTDIVTLALRAGGVVGWLRCLMRLFPGGFLGSFELFLRSDRIPIRLVSLQPKELGYCESYADAERRDVQPVVREVAQIVRATSYSDEQSSPRSVFRCTYDWGIACTLLEKLLVGTHDDDSNYRQGERQQSPRGDSP